MFSPPTLNNIIHNFEGQVKSLHSQISQSSAPEHASVERGGPRITGLLPSLSTPGSILQRKGPCIHACRYSSPPNLSSDYIRVVCCHC